MPYFYCQSLTLYEGTLTFQKGRIATTKEAILVSLAENLKIEKILRSENLLIKKKSITRPQLNFEEN